MGDFFMYNGRLLRQGQEIREVATASSRSGDGLFETLRLHKGGILLEDYHFERLFQGIQAVNLHPPAPFTTDHVQELILQVCQANGNYPTARVRLTIFRDPASPHLASVLIESWQLDDQYVFPPEGLRIGIYGAAQKNVDGTAAYKTNYMLYAMAYAHAQDHGMDNCLIMNNAGNICDAAIDNVFWIKRGEVFTPPLSEGGISGVMRRHLLTLLPQHGFKVSEMPLDIHTLAAADEVFLTNVIRGIRPVEYCQGMQYRSVFTRQIFNALVAPLTKNG